MELDVCGDPSKLIVQSPKFNLQSTAAMLLLKQSTILMRRLSPKSPLIAIPRKTVQIQQTRHFGIMDTITDSMTKRKEEKVGEEFQNQVSWV